MKSKYLPRNPIRRVLLGAFIAFAHSKNGIKLASLGRIPNPRDHTDWLEITQLRLALPRLPVAFSGYRIVHISDLHLGTWLNQSILDQVVEQVNGLKPDLIAITGDFVTYQPELYAPGIIEALSRLKSNDGVLAVLGNHDHWSDAQVIRQSIDSAGAIDMSNRIISLNRESNFLHVAGVDSHYLRLDRLDLVIEQMPSEGAAILLVHEPDYADISAATGRFDLQLSGHSHGGQVRLPGLGAIFLPYLARRYPYGLYQIDGMQLYANRGLGTAELQIRINCPPEIAVITLEQSSSGIVGSR